MLGGPRSDDRTVAGIVDAGRERRKASDHRRIGLSVDEWNVWHLTEHREREDPGGPFRRAPALAEDEHDIADALVVGCLLDHALAPRGPGRGSPASPSSSTSSRPSGPSTAARRGSRRPPTRSRMWHASARGTVLRLELDGPTTTLAAVAHRGHRSRRRPRRRRGSAHPVRGQPGRPTTIRLEAMLRGFDRPGRRRAVGHWPTPTFAAHEHRGRSATGSSPHRGQRRHHRWATRLAVRLTCHAPGASSGCAHARLTAPPRLSRLPRPGR